MQRAKIWIFAAFLAGVISGPLLVSATGWAAPGADDRDWRGRSHWRHHDGHWNYWHDGDKRWYHTDGKHWYSRGDNDDRWNHYRFDKGYGRDGFERKSYRIPGTDVRIEVPRHNIFR
jgi:hypothetical protein